MLGISLDPRVQDTFTVFLAIVVEATPFIIFGVLIALLLEKFVSTDWLIKHSKGNRLLSHLIPASLGFLFPVCECGNVPVTRQLIAKGYSVSQAVSFFLGAPILNIVVFATTIAAFGGTPIIVITRMLAGLFIATLTGILVSYLAKPGGDDKELISQNLQDFCDHHHTKKRLEFNPRNIFNTLTSKETALSVITEFSGLFKYLVIGAGIAALTQIWLPRELVFTLASNPVLAIIAMMLLALVISVCSTVDAFVALAYVNQFSPSAILGFLIYGPMIDIKAITMLLSSFKPKLVFFITAVVTILTFAIANLVTYLGY